MICGARAEIYDRHQRRAIDRCAVTHKRGVSGKRDDRRDHRRPAEPARQPEPAEQEPRENRNVAAGNGDDVVRPGFLQPALHVGVQPRAIADDDRRDDRTRLRAPAPHVFRDRAAGVRARTGHRLVEPASGRQHLNQRAALHRPHEPRAASRQRALVVGHTGVEIPRRPVERDRQPHPPPSAPVVDSIRGERTRDRDDDTA